MAKIGLALGGGGAKGLSHILMLEALEELGLRASYVTGTSVGAIAGVLYCSGLSAAEMRASIEEMSVLEDDTLETILKNKHVFKWLDFVAPQFAGGGLMKSEQFINFLFAGIKANTFEELEIPLRVVAADFWSREPVVLDKGELPPAIQASMSLPGAFAPVVLDGRVLVDGGGVNPVPFDLLPDDCDLTIAIDVIGQRTVGEQMMPSVTEAVFNTFQIMEKSIIREKLRHSAPDIYIEPEIEGVKVLEFFKAQQIFQQALPAKQKLKREIEKRLG